APSVSEAPMEDIEDVEEAPGPVTVPEPTLSAAAGAGGDGGDARARRGARRVRRGRAPPALLPRRRDRRGRVGGGAARLRGPVSLQAGLSRADRARLAGPGRDPSRDRPPRPAPHAVPRPRRGGAARGDGGALPSLSRAG